MATNQPADSSNEAPIGIVLVNLGTPDEPRPRAVARFLRQFLSDRRVVELPPPLWRLCLEVCLLPWRCRTSAAKYASVWRPDGSPIMVHSAEQAASLDRALGDGYVVRHAMRYGSPAVGKVIDELTGGGIGRILVVPMFPQYSQTTVASVFDAVAAHLAGRRNQPELRFVRSFATDPAYIAALAEQVETVWRTDGRPDFAGGDRLLLSFHGIPLSMADDGDPYRSECLATAAALRARLGLGPAECLVTFQSKFGPGKWLEPPTIGTVRQLGAQGLSRLDVFCPGFVADCLETLEEIDLLNHGAYKAAGGGRFVRIPCLGAAPAFIEALTGLVHRHTAGWRAADN